MAWTEMIPPGPSEEGRTNLTDKVRVFAHHSSVHDGINIEIDAEDGVQVTVHLNDALIADEMVGR
jgi:hypothetical protein